MRIAIDGPAASGKGTLARAAAGLYGLPYLDTGLLYRAVAHALEAAGADAQDAEAAARAALALDPEALPPEAELRLARFGEGASVVSAHPGVRSALLGLQRAFAARQGGAVLDGRDIGSVVCPDAEVKVFVTAPPETRARRRHADLVRHEPGLAYEDVLADIVRRDARDSGRPDAPLSRCPEALLVDTSGADPKGCLALLSAHVEALGLTRAKGFTTCS
jgi:cytidylate kinase